MTKGIKDYQCQDCGHKFSSPELAGQPDFEYQCLKCKGYNVKLVENQTTKNGE